MTPSITATAARILNSIPNATQQTTRRLRVMRIDFEEWCHTRHINPDAPSADDLVEFIEDLAEQRDWAPASANTSLSQVARLLDDQIRIPIQASQVYIRFHRNNRLSIIQPVRDGSYDLAPVVAHLRSLGPNEQLSPRDLARKTAWLLALIGLLRPSDLARVDLPSCRFDRNLGPPDRPIMLAIVAPKEKRNGAAYTRSVTFHPHPDPILCPVAVFYAYLRQFDARTRAARSSHPARPDHRIVPIFRVRANPTRPVKASTIASYIRDIMVRVRRDPPTLKIPKARATLAAQAGVNVDDIVARGAWSSRETFEHFYRISSQHRTNFTLVTLDDPTSQQSSQCSIM